MFLSYISGYILGRFSHINGLASLFISFAEYLLSLLYFPLFFLNFPCFLAQKARLVALLCCYSDFESHRDKWSISPLKKSICQGVNSKKVICLVNFVYKRSFYNKWKINTTNSNQLSKITKDQTKDAYKQD